MPKIPCLSPLPVQTHYAPTHLPLHRPQLTAEASQPLLQLRVLLLLDAELHTVLVRLVPELLPSSGIMLLLRSLVGAVGFAVQAGRCRSTELL